MHKVLRHEAEAERVDISKQTVVSELRREGSANPYVDAGRRQVRQKSDLFFVVATLIVFWTWIGLLLWVAGVF
jgi:hypothetical protein